MSGVCALKPLAHICLGVEMGVGSKDYRVLAEPPHLRASWHRRGYPAAWDLGLPTGSGEPQLMNIHEGGWHLLTTAALPLVAPYSACSQ